jgi:hypothetical protein
LLFVFIRFYCFFIFVFDAQHVLLKEKEETITVNIPEGSWVTFNDGQTGLYRVHYPSSYLSSLAKAKLVPIPQVYFLCFFLVAFYFSFSFCYVIFRFEWACRMTCLQLHVLALPPHRNIFSFFPITKMKPSITYGLTLFPIWVCLNTCINYSCSFPFLSLFLFLTYARYAATSFASSFRKYVSSILLPLAQVCYNSFCCLFSLTHSHLTHTHSLLLTHSHSLLLTHSHFTSHSHSSLTPPLTLTLTHSQ